MQTHKTFAEVPVIGEYDLVVAGGGLAGFGAACAAARKGADTLLIERLEILGGLGSAGGVGNFSYGRDYVKGQGEVFDDIIDGLKRHNAIGEENGYRRHHSELFYNITFDHSLLPLVLLEIAEESGVELLFATDVVGANTVDGRVAEVFIHNRSLLQAVRGTIFIDGTGDGILSRHAGGESLPVEDEEHPELLKPGLMIFLRRADEPQEQICLEIHELEGEPDYSIWSEPGHIGLKSRIFERNFDTGSGAGYSEATAEFRKKIPAFVRHYQKNHDPDYVFDYAAFMLGLREGRRIRGDYVLRSDDLRVGKSFRDSVAYATSCLDVTSKADKPKVPPYQIPYRSLIVDGTDNLFVVGRCFSADRLALSSARVMPTCCLMGQAAGYASVIAAEENRGIREVSPARIREELLDGARDQKIMAERLCPKD